MKRSLWLVPIMLPLLFAGCSCSEGDSTGLTSTATSGVGGGVGGGSGGGGEGGGFECPLGNAVCQGVCCDEGERCIDGVCCAPEASCNDDCCGDGEICMGGFCHPDCSAGANLCLDLNGTEMCCTSPEICFMSSCVAPSGACSDDVDCALDEYCEQAIAACLPIPTSDCEYYPPIGDFTPVVEWTWPPAGGSAVQPNYVDVLTAPAVGDMDGDGIPEVAFVGYRDACAGGGYWTGLLTILRGDTGAEVLRLDDPARRLGSSTAPVMGDLDGDGLPEVVVIQQTGYRLLAYKIDGTLLWEAQQPTVSMATGAIGMADLDGDGHPNVFHGPNIYDSYGNFVCSGTASVGGSGSRGIATAADLDMDGDMELVAGNAAYHHDCSVYWHNSSIGDGYVAVADIFQGTGVPGQDGSPEVALISSGQLFVLDGQDGAVLWGPHDIPGNTSANFGGAPTVGDFDGDGLPEIGTAGGAYMVVFDPDGPSPVLWQQPTKDTSSAITGSTVFDFEGDGTAEIVYTDECFVFIYSGPDGSILFQEPNNTRTHNEFPIVVDVDADGNSELLVTSNVCVWGCDALPGWSGPAQRGIKIYGDAQMNWVRTRKVWNEHAYHVTNVNDDCTIPTPEPFNWTDPDLNNFRQNVQTWGVHNAPNLTPELFGADNRDCLDGIIRLGLMVENKGSKGVPAGLNIGFYRVLDNDQWLPIGSAQTTQPLLPGMIEYVELEWTIPPDEMPLETVVRFGVVVDDPALGEVAIHECIEDDNTAGPIEADCEVLQ